jgi:hypothetical protein
VRPAREVTRRSRCPPVQSLRAANTARRSTGRRAGPQAAPGPPAAAPAGAHGGGADPAGDPGVRGAASLALPLPNGDILVNDDFNNRVIVIDPVTHRIVWQYGHTGVADSKPGYLHNPDGVDLTPANSLLITHSATMGPP